ncbi:Zn(II)2Cys6 transcription factor [Phanerochaete sordida]|uniref:Zn(II)2Cys6 transcription factor n=1 Tax=Phanerochaete sordida TaxID=48140 RepID=A0A9P3LHW0_9APHY|nr:Zn(II)2Cys6 transcription factor [Phanerochaete sordida]
MPSEQDVITDTTAENDIVFEVEDVESIRVRTTQSCLNCHTSKRKCDRKRPCQRCIQLGLVGLCVYEVDSIVVEEVYETRVHTDSAAK